MFSMFSKSTCWRGLVCVTNLRLTPRDWEIHSKSSTSSGFTLGRSSESDSIDCTTCLPLSLDAVQFPLSKCFLLARRPFSPANIRKLLAKCLSASVPKGSNLKSTMRNGTKRSRRRWIKVLKGMLSSPPFRHHH